MVYDSKNQFPARENVYNELVYIEYITCIY